LIISFVQFSSKKLSSNFFLGDQSYKTVLESNKWINVVS
jgi:hypothetical protein